MHPLITSSLFVFALGLTACNERTPATSQESASNQPAESELSIDVDAVAIVNGKPITRARYESYMAQRKRSDSPGANPAAEPAEAGLNELVAAELVYQDAIAKGLRERSEISAAIDAMERSLLTQAVIKEQMETNPVSAAQLQEIYNQRVAGKGTSEAHIRHILTETEAAANEALAELDKGGDFAAVAAKHSADDTRDAGGDLGWIIPEDTDPAMSVAITALEPGAYTAKPVNSKYGWHIILLEERRETPPPGLEEIRPQLEQFIQQLAIQQYIFSLRNNADITLNLPAPAPAASAGDS